MSGNKAIWGTAIVLSLMTHAGAAAILTYSPEPQPDVSQIAGGVVAEVAMLGNSAFEAVEAGTPEEIQPTDTVEPEAFEPVTQEVAAVEPQEIVPQEMVPTEVAPTPEAAEIVPEMSEAIEVQGAEVEIAAIPIPEIKPEIVERPPEMVKPLERKAEKPVEKKKVENRKKKAGDKGDSAQALIRGQVDGSQDAKTSASGGQKKGNASSAGNAAVSNYPGKVRNKINRAKRRFNGNGGGVATVSFVVSASGQATSIRIARSSGQPALDEAALEAVRRAAPFPEIPDGAGRASWPFSVPISFKR